MPKAAIPYQYIEASAPATTDAKTVITMGEWDCLEAAQTLLEKAPGPVCVLNMANPLYVGGEYLTSLGSQEESLIRRTNLLGSLLQLDNGIKKGSGLHPHLYDIPNRLNFFARADDGLGEFTCLYSEGVAVHCVTEQDPDDNVQKTTPKVQFEINVISSAAYNLGALSEQTAFNNDLYWAGSILKIINQLRTAKLHQQRRLVLSAFGCGAFHNDASLIASWYHSILHEFEFQGCFDQIYFAIKSPATGDNKNYEVFKHVFSRAPQLLRDFIKKIQPPSPDRLGLGRLLTSLTTIRCPQELYTVAQRILAEELSVSHSKGLSEDGSNTPQISKGLLSQHRRRFFDRVLESLNQHTQHTRSVLRSVFLGPDYLNLASTARISKQAFFPPSLQKIKNLLEQAESTITEEESWETLTPTQFHLAQELLEDYILDGSVKLLNHCQERDREISCFLMYIAATKDRDTLLDYLEGRYVKLPAIHNILLALNEFCLGERAHISCSSIADKRFFCGAGEDLPNWQTKVQQSVGRYIAFRLVLLLKLGYGHFFEGGAFETFLETGGSTTAHETHTSDAEGLPVEITPSLILTTDPTQSPNSRTATKTSSPGKTLSSP